MALPTEQQLKGLAKVADQYGFHQGIVLIGSHKIGSDEIFWSVTKSKDDFSAFINVAIMGASAKVIKDFVTKIGNFIASKWGFEVNNHKSILEGGVFLYCWRIPYSLEV